MAVITPRHFARIAFALVGLFVFWRVQNSDDKLYVFLVYLVGLFVEEFAMRAFRGNDTTSPRPSPNANQYPEWGDTDAYTAPQASRARPSALADFVTIFIAVLVLAVMGDCVFFTDWLTLAEPGEAKDSGLLALVKIILNVCGFAVAFIAPIVAGLFFWYVVSDAASARDRSPLQSDALGCLAVVPAAIVAAIGYGHFLLAYRFYEAIGALAHR